MKRLIVSIMLICFVFCINASAVASRTRGTDRSISPHAVGVCAPNEPITPADEPEEETPEEDEIEEEPDDDQEEDEPSEEPEEDSETTEDEDLTIEEMVRANRDPDSEIWYHIEDKDCLGHEWEYYYDGVEDFRACLNCGKTECLETSEESDEEEWAENWDSDNDMFEEKLEEEMECEYEDTLEQVGGEEELE